MTRSLRASAVVLVALAAAALTGCSPTVAMQPAAGANDPLCADVIVRLPPTVDGQARRWTDAQATGAWGNPTAVLLKCGLEPPGPSTLRCITIGGVDWLVDESESPRFRLMTYGRTPAVEVYLDNELVSPNDALDELSRAVSMIPATGACTAPEAPPED